MHLSTIIRFSAFNPATMLLLLALGVPSANLLSGCTKKCQPGSALVEGGVCRRLLAYAGASSGEPESAGAAAPAQDGGIAQAVESERQSSAGAGASGANAPPSQAPMAPLDAGPGAAPVANESKVDAGVTGPAECSAAERTCGDSGVRQCGADNQWMEDTPCPFVCVAGACTGTCKPGSKQCSDTTIQECSEQGEWVDGIMCPNICSNGDCAGSCVPGAKQCTGDAPQSCNDSGTWDLQPRCDFVCSEGACTGMCRPNEVRCSGTSVETCDATGSWQAGTSCPYVCEDGACAGVCRPNDVRCSDLRAETCGSRGDWETTETCPNLCFAGRCTGSCRPQEKRCTSGSRQETCSATGQWGGGQVSTDCGAECIPGQPLAMPCDGAIPLTCDRDGRIARGRAEANKCGAICTAGQNGCDYLGDSNPPCFGASCEVHGESASQVGECTEEGTWQLLTYCAFVMCADGTQQSGCRNGVCATGCR
jgi:hypothetical protein